jgi:hypothetical protein
LIGIKRVKHGFLILISKKQRHFQTAPPGSFPGLAFLSGSNFCIYGSGFLPGVKLARDQLPKENVKLSPDPLFVSMSQCNRKDASLPTQHGKDLYIKSLLIARNPLT